MIDVVAAVIVKDNKFLITRRAPKLKLEGMWEFPGGKIELGESREEALIREVKEELGIDASVSDLHFVDKFVINYKKEFYGKMFKDSEIAFVYVYTGSVDIDKLTLQKEELDRVDWFNLEYVYEECKKHNQKFCAPIDGLEIARKYVCEYGI